MVSNMAPSKRDVVVESRQVISQETRTRWARYQLKGRVIRELKLPASARTPKVGHHAHLEGAFRWQYLQFIVPDTFRGISVELRRKVSDALTQR